MEPPSLESTGGLEGQQYQQNPEMAGQGRSLFRRSGAAGGGIFGGLIGGIGGVSSRSSSNDGGGYRETRSSSFGGGIGGGFIGGIGGASSSSRNSYGGGSHESRSGVFGGGIAGGLIGGISVRNSGSYGSSSGGALGGGGYSGGLIEGGGVLSGHKNCHGHGRSLEEEKKQVDCWKKSNVPPKQRKLCNKPHARSLEVLEDSDIKMIERERKETPMKEVAKMQMQPIEGEAVEKDLKDNMREKIETYTETYVVTTLMTRTYTRKRIFIQKRKVINQKIIRPVVVVRRKIIKERQLFERIIPKIIETREIINHPAIKSKVVEGPIVELTTIDDCDIPQQPVMKALPPPPPEVNEEECPEVVFDMNSGETVDAAQTVYGSNTGYGYQG